MMTVRHIEKLWDEKCHVRLCEELLSSRPERDVRLARRLTLAPAVAALAIIRLDELSQRHVPLYGKLVRRMLSFQEEDGGWADPLTTALCLRALLCGRGDGEAIDRGLTYLANLQKSEGLWPAVPIRRLPADAYVSVFILFQLSNHTRFRDKVRYDDAIAWFEANSASLETETAKLWCLISLRRPTAPDALKRHESLWAKEGSWS